MLFKRRTLLIITSFTIGFGLAVYANPGIAACVIASHPTVYSIFHQQLISESRSRIENMFGTPRSQPIVVFFSDPDAYWPFTLNQYGSTNFIGPKTCVIVGPKGQTPDVVAHELMHAEIADRVGFWGRLRQLPVWFDEGLAMQVDFRPQYALSEGATAETEYVKTLSSYHTFFVSDDGLLTKHYASAKAVVALWVAEVGKISVYSELERIRTGELFQTVIKGK